MRKISSEKLTVKPSKKILTQATGLTVYNIHGEKLGKIVEITHDEENTPQYVIIRSDHFFGMLERYFAVPVCTAFLKIGEKNKIVIAKNRMITYLQQALVLANVRN